MHCRLTLATLAVPALLAAQTPPPASRPAAKAHRVDAGPAIDGRLNDAAWAGAPPLSAFVQHEPFDNQAATERTEVRIVFDRDALYIGARLYDSDPAGIIRGEVRRDANLKEQDSFLILLDTYLDRQNGFAFGTTPSGIEHDGQVTREGEGGFGGPATGTPQVAGGQANLNWDATWTVATSVDSLGWVAEFRIPFETLRYSGGSPQTWGLNFSRFIRRKNEEDFWAPVPRQHSLYRVSLAGTLEGVMPPTRRVALVTPYALGTLHRDFVAAAKTDAAVDVGVDAKLGVTPSLTLDLTYNTDFAQVEVDEQQINLTRFNLFFPEKRPFFLENAGTFAVGTPESVELFFSRRIGIDGTRSVPLLGGGRLTGKVGGLTLGLLDIQTERVRDQEVILTPPENFAVARVLKELPRRSRVGVIAVSRFNADSTGDRNVTVGADARLGIGERITLDLYAAHSETPSRTGASNLANLSGSYLTRNWEIGMAVRQVDPDFNPEVGYLERPTFRYYNVRFLRHLRTPNVGWFREFRPHVTFRQYDDTDGRPQSRLFHFDSHFVFANGAFFESPVNFVREVLRTPFQISPGVVIPAGVYDWVEWATIYNTNLSAPYAISGRGTVGAFYTGRRISSQISFIARPNEKFNATVRWNYEHVVLDEGRFDRVLLGLRLAYTFTPRMYLQSLTQWNNQNNSLSANVRFGWLGPAGTGLFVVFNEGRETGPNHRPLDRALAVKFTRQFDLAH
ncbi:MAG: carbohydrate binding family 9 domain-containing protein [Gemmatimonadales bacterium]|nr:carbohydrate binding family 9 domain-containing protein [Gemmatimonadales bacterium]